jgi:tetratricopeptide (TPR) repeat protein
VCLVVAAVALLATWRGADRSRTPLDARQHVQDTLALALAEGNRSPGVLDNLRRLRAELGRRPLDSKSRVQYAALLLSMTRTLDDTRAAAFHARLAADLAPVTLPVVELAALVLARSGERAGALARIRDIFEFAPEAAAGLLLQMEDSLDDQTARAALPDTPAAWCAWARALARSGRPEASVALLHEAATRWPDDLEVNVALARLALRAADWDELELRAGRDTIPAEGRGLELLVYRARWHVERGRPDAADRDLATLLAAAKDKPHLLILAGDVQRRMGSDDLARQTWNRALFKLSPKNKSLRVALLVRLAALEEDRGRAGVALRHWRRVLESDPSHARARRRVADLTGIP